MAKTQLFLVGLMVMALLGTTSAYTVVDSSPKTLLIHSDGSFDITSGTPSGGLQAGEKVETGMILILNEFGTYEFIPASTSNNALEAFFNYNCGTCTSLTDAQTKARQKCNAFSSNYINTNTKCTLGQCITDCEPSGSKCSKNSDCVPSGTCTYCRYGQTTCTLIGGVGTCNYAPCGNRTQCGVASECTTNEDAKSVCEARIQSQYGGSKYVAGYKCTDGNAICTTGSTCRVECTIATDPACKTKASAACTYGYSSSSCNVQRDCSGDIKCATCTYNCNNAPSPTIYCGDGKCNGDETKTSCAQDCGVIQPPSTTCGDGICGGTETRASCPQDCQAPTGCGNGACDAGESCSNCVLDCGNCGETGCTAGYTGSPSCSGNNVVQDYKFADCSTQTDVTSACQYGCKDGVCLSSSTCDASKVTCTATQQIDMATCQCVAKITDPICGDGVCNGDETTVSCQKDCPTCTGPLCGGGGGGLDQTTLYILVGGAVIAGGIAIWWLMRK